jgi:WD40 repeat protein
MDEAGARGDSFTFSAFISYARKDRAEAVRLQRRLEQYRLDADLRVKEGERFFPARPLQPVFRDEDELVPGQDLPERIRKGLASSRYLIVIASTASVQSQWVEREILDFMAMGKADRIIILVIDGEPNAVRAGKAANLESLPRPFRVKFTAEGHPTDQPAPEPNWVDWRGRRKSDRINFLRLVSALLELDRFDDLLRRDARNERRRLRLFQAATFVVVALGLAAALGAVLAARQLNEVRTTESRFLARLADDLAQPAGDAAKGDHLRALQIAIDGAPTANLAVYPRPLTLETESALRRSVSHLRLERFFQHKFGVRAAALSPDGKRVATASRSPVPSAETSVITIWDVESGAPVREPVEVADGAFATKFSVAFSPDGTRVLVGAGTAAHLFDAATGARIGRPLTDTGEAGARELVRFSANGERVLTADGLWDGRTAAHIRPISKKLWADQALDRIVALAASDTTQLIDGVAGAPIGTPVKHGGAVVDVAFSGDRIAIAAKDRTISLWDATAGKPAGIVVTTTAEPIAVYLTAGGTRLLTITGVWEAPREAQLWDTRTGKPIGDAATASAEFGVAFSLDGTRLALTSDEDTATGGRLIDTTTGKTLAVLDYPRVHFSPDGRFLLTVGAEGQAQLWNATTNLKIGGPIVRGGDINDVAFSSDGTHVVLTSPDGASLWQTTGRFVGELKHDDSAANARFSPITHVAALSASFGANGASVLTVSSDASARLWNALPNLLTPEKVTHPARITGIAVAPGGKTLATAGEDKSVRLWDARSGAAVGTAMAHDGPIDRLAFSSDGARLLTLAGGDAHLWDARTGVAIATPLKHEGVVGAATFGPQGNRLATASNDGSAKLWDARTGAQIGSPMQHANDVRSVAFSPDGTRLLTVSGPEEGNLSDGTWGAPTGEARLWNAMTGAPLGSPMKHAAFVHAATFSPDGLRVATASVDKTARVWDGHTGAPLQTIKHVEKVTGVAFNAGGSRLLTMTFGELDAGGQVHLWTAAGKRIADMAQGNPRSAHFSPDGTKVATNGFLTEDAYLFDAVTGKPLAAVTHKGLRGMGIWRMMFTPDGLMLASSGGGAVRLWDARTGASIGGPLEGEIVEGADAHAVGATHVVTANGADALFWSIAAWNRTGAPLIAQACEKLTSVGAGPLPRDLSDRAFRNPSAPHACKQRGLLDWRFYADVLFGGR